jgi:hypothetical protein
MEILPVTGYGGGYFVLHSPSGGGSDIEGDEMKEWFKDNLPIILFLLLLFPLCYGAKLLAEKINSWEMDCNGRCDKLCRTHCFSQHYCPHSEDR